VKHKADILIITVTPVESKAVMQVFQEVAGKAPTSTSIDDRVYFDLGEVSGNQVFMALSEMGSGGLGGSQKAVEKGIKALSPSAVIMTGIAFGINEKKQAIGDILVSRQLMLYDLQRVSTSKEGNIEIIPRGDRPHASPRLINYFQSALLSWDDAIARVRSGLILSGDKLADNVDFREQLLKFEPEAIGGEMEGAGLYVACQDSKVDWILVKAICDWADGNKSQDKDQRQRLAAHNAASLTLHVIRQGYSYFPIKGKRPREIEDVERQMNQFWEKFWVLSRELEEWKELHHFLNSLYMDFKYCHSEAKDLNSKIYEWGIWRFIPSYQRAIEQCSGHWDHCKNRMIDLRHFAERLKHIDDPYDPGKQKGPSWMFELSATQQRLERALLDNKPRDIFDQSDAFAKVVDDYLTKADHSLRRVADHINNLRRAYRL
jgi:nucleoside phosphorylase